MFSITVKSFDQSELLYKTLLDMSCSMGGKLYKTAFYLKKENVDPKAPLNATESLQRDRTCRSVGKFR